MKHGGHHNEGTHRDHYQPNNPGTDLQDALFGRQLRTIVADLFRGITVSHSPDLFQTLPAKKHYFEMSLELVALDRQTRGPESRASIGWTGTAAPQSAHGETQTEENRASQSPRKLAVQASLNTRKKSNPLVVTATALAALAV
jgi:hypothetical protein